MNQLWLDFLRHTARQSKVGTVRTLDGVEVAWLNSPLPFFNATFLTSPPVDAADLARRLEVAKADAAERPLGWGFYTYDPDHAACPVPAESGLGRVMGVRVMTGDVAQLAAPQHPLPNVEFRRIADDAGSRHCMVTNLAAYGMPLEIADSVVATGAFFKDPAREFGYVATVNGEVVSTTAVVLLEPRWLYVAMVATVPEHRKKGYAEAVMRHALQEAAAATGVTRTSLDASDAGAPLYAQMGYAETGETWSLWMLPH